VSLLVCVATPLEGGLLRERLSARADVTLICTGVGAVNAAHAVTLAMTRARPDAVIVCGVGGAYPESGLAIGDVVCADVECYGDLGAATPSGFLDMKALGFPVIPGSAPVYNDLPLAVFPLERRVKFVTVNACTGTDPAARALEARTGGAVENMEGAAVVHVARLHDVPVGELRGISNMVTDRDTGAWRLEPAAIAAQEALVAWLSRR
jgi:futalosine hydrolase